MDGSVLGADACLINVSFVKFLVVTKQEPARGIIFSIFNYDSLVGEASSRGFLQGEVVVLDDALAHSRRPQ